MYPTFQRVFILRLYPPWFCRVMAALNCLRFLLLRDPVSVNETGIWSHIPHIEQGFIEPLHTGIKLSMAHYQARMTAVVNEHKARGKSKLQSPICISVNWGVTNRPIQGMLSI